MRRTPESCKAGWLWLKNTRPDLITRTDNDAEDYLIIAREKRHGACFQSVILKPITSHECCTPFSSNSLPACWLKLGIPFVFSLICNGSIAFLNTERQTGPPYEYDTSSDHPSGVGCYLVLVWDGNPTLQQLRWVLILVDLQEVRHVMEGTLPC